MISNKTIYVGDSLFTLSNLLTENEIQNILAKAQSRGWKESPVSGGGHGRTGNEEPRTSKFCVLYDENISTKLYERVTSYIPDDLSFMQDNVYFNSASKGSEWTKSHVFSKLRLYKYNEGDAFPEHLDYKVQRKIVKMDKDRKEFRRYVQQSFLTLLVYLNDDFEGGETGYWPDQTGIRCRFLNKDEKLHSKKEHQIKIVPTKGTGVIQDQNILHEGIPPIKGTKYILRTDIIHEKCIIPHPKLNENLNCSHEEQWSNLFETSCKNYAD